MAKKVKSNPVLVSFAERVGTTVGLIVAKTTSAVEGATKSFRTGGGKARATDPSKNKAAKPVKRTVKSKAPLAKNAKKKSVRRPATPRKPRSRASQ